MLKKWMIIGIFTGLCLVLNGCGGSKEKASTDTVTPAGQAVPTDAKDKTSSTAPVNLDIQSSTTAEGVTNLFLKAFFGGDDKTAYSFLTSKAQTATKETFTASANDSIRWEVTKKIVDPATSNSLVTVCVNDLNDDGTTSQEELVFTLSQDAGNWRVAGFKTGSLSISFEEVPIPEHDSTDNGVKVGQANVPGIK